MRRPSPFNNHQKVVYLLQESCRQVMGDQKHDSTAICSHPYFPRDSMGGTRVQTRCGFVKKQDACGTSEHLLPKIHPFSLTPRYASFQGISNPVFSNVANVEFMQDPVRFFLNVRRAHILRKARQPE